MVRSEQWDEVAFTVVENTIVYIRQHWIHLVIQSDTQLHYCIYGIVSGEVKCFVPNVLMKTEIKIEHKKTRGKEKKW